MATVSALPLRPAGLQIDRRNAQEAVEVAVAFKLYDGPRVLAGLGLSRRQLSVADDEQGRAAIAAPARNVDLCVALAGFDLVLPLRIVASPATRPGFGRLRFDIVGIDQRTEKTLVQLIRTSLTGWMPEADDLTKGWDEETPIRLTGTPQPERRGTHWLWSFLGVLLLLSGLAAVAYQLYLAVATIQVETAAVTAQRIDILSPDYGIVAPHDITAGKAVSPGQPLISVQSPGIQSDLEIETANSQFAAARLAAEAMTAGAALPGGKASPAKVDLDRAVGRLKALQRRKDGLAFNALCTCTVLWAAKPGSTVAPGALLISLVVSDPAEIRVEALVRPRDAISIQTGQAAMVSLAGSDRRYRAAVETVRYDSSPVPKVGLGSDRNGRATVILRITDPTDALVPGNPANVVIFQ